MSALSVFKSRVDASAAREASGASALPSAADVTVLSAAARRLVPEEQADDEGRDGERWERDEERWVLASSGFAEPEFGGAFDVSALVGRLKADAGDAQDGGSEYAALLCGFDPAPLRGHLGLKAAELERFGAAVDAQLALVGEAGEELRGSCSERLDESRQRVAGQLSQRVSDLQQRAAGFAATTTRIGEQLKQLDRSLNRAGDCQTMMELLERARKASNEAGGGDEGAGAAEAWREIFGDDPHKAIIDAKRLNKFSADISSVLGPDAPVYIEATAKLYGDLQNYLQEQFFQCLSEKDWATMKDYAVTGEQVDPGMLEKPYLSQLMAADHSEGDKKRQRLRRASIGAIGEDTDELQQTYLGIAKFVRVQAKTINKVFPVPGRVVGSLIIRVFEERVSMYVDALLGANNQIKDPLHYCHTLAKTVARTHGLATQLAKQDTGDVKPLALATDMLAAHAVCCWQREQEALDLVIREKWSELKDEEEDFAAVAKAKGKAVIRDSATLMREHTLSAAVTPAKPGHIRHAGQKASEEVLREYELENDARLEGLAEAVKDVFAHVEEAIVRSRLISEDEERASQLTKMFDLLTGELDVLLQNVVYVGHRRKLLNAENYSSTIGELKAPKYNALMIVRVLQSVMGAVSRSFENTVVPNTSRFLHYQEQCMEKQRALVGSVEGGAGRLLASVTKAIVGEALEILKKEQGKEDFVVLPKWEGGGIAVATPSCKACIASMKEHFYTAQSFVDGVNLHLFLGELGRELHRRLLDFYRKLKVSVAGAPQFKQDLREWEAAVRPWKHPRVAAQFALLRECAELFGCTAPQIRTVLFHKGSPAPSLRSLPRSEVRKLLQMRAAHRSEKSDVDKALR